MTEPRTIRRSELERLLIENETLAELLRTWPARKILMDYEKEWNERREEALRNQGRSELTSGS